MSKLPWWLKLCVQILLVDLVIAILVLGWSWFTKDFSTVSLSNRFVMGGALVILLGVSAGLGNWENRADWQQIFARSAGPASLNERNQQMMTEILEVDSFMLLMIPTGLIAILIGILLGQFT